MGSLENKFIAAVGRASDQRGKPALLGKGDGTLYWVDDSGMTHRTRVWARIGEQASNQLVVVDCLKASPQIDMPVRVDYVNGRLTVVDVDGQRAVEFGGGRPGAAVAAHAWLHSRLGPDPVYIEGLQFLPLLVTPTNPPDLTVTVQGGAYTDSAGDLAIHDTAVSGSTSAFVPTTDYHFVIVCLNRATGAIVLVDGSDITAEDVLFSDVVVTAADIEAITISADYKTLGVVLLYPGQTQIKAKDIVMDLRTDGGAGGGTPGGSDTHVQYNKAGVFAGDNGLTYNDTSNTLTGNRIIVGAGETVDAEAKFAVILLSGPTTPDQSIPFHNPATGDFNNTAFDFLFENASGAQNLYASIEANQIARTAGSESGGLTFYIDKAGTLTPVVTMYGSTGETSFLGQDVIVKGTGNDSLLTTDFSANTVGVGTNGAAGSIVSFGPSGVVINNGEADRDFRIAGSGVTNGYFYDAELNFHGFNNGSPSATVHIVGDNTAFGLHVSNNAGVALFERAASAVATVNTFYNPDTTDSNQIAINFTTDTTGTGATVSKVGAQLRVQFDTHNDATYANHFEWWNRQSGTFAERMSLGAGLVVGSPTGGDKGAGWVNVAGGVSLNNSNYANPDYAVHHYFFGDMGPFADNPGAEHYAGLVPLDKLENYLRKNLHLPNRWESQNVFEWADMAQMWCEELAIYITQLHKRVKELENA